MGLEDKMLGSKSKHAVIIPDLHVPYHDEKAVSLVEQYIKNTKPDALYQIGDFYDFYSISRFDKDPKRIDSLQDELDVGYSIWKRFRDAGKPEMEMHYTEGNHEFRLRKYLWRHPGINSLRSLKLENATNIKDLGIKFYKNHQECYINKVLIATHGAKDDGCKLSQYSGYSAKNTLEKNAINGVSGHSHRLSSHFSRKMGGQLEWHEMGCLCTLNPDYVKKPNWQQGFGRVIYNQKKFDIKPIKIHQENGQYWAIVDGKIYKSQKSQVNKNGKAKNTKRKKN